MRTSFGIIMWLVLCASLALVWGSGASRYAYGDDPDSMPLFYAGLACFAVAGIGALVIKATGEPVKQDSTGGILFFSVTALVAMAIGIGLDATN